MRFITQGNTNMNNIFHKGDKVVHCYGSYKIGRVMRHTANGKLLVFFEPRHAGKSGLTRTLQPSSIRHHIGF